MAVVQKAFAHLRGANLEFGTLTLNPASLGDNAQGEYTVTVTGAKAGDLIFVNAEDLDVGLAVVGAKVTATDTITIYINNESGGAVDGANLTYSYMLVHLS